MSLIERIKMKRFECVIDLPWVNPVREAHNKEEFIENILTEYNKALDGLVEITRGDIREVKCEEYE